MRLLLPVLILCVFISSCGEKKKRDEMKVLALTSPSVSPSAEPYLFTDEKGTAYLSWIEKKSDTASFKLSELTDDRWSAPVLISEGTNWFVNWADYPMITKNKELLLAHFLRRNGEGHVSYDVVLTSSQDQGKTWTEPLPVHDDGKQAEHGFVSFLPYEGGFFVAWLDGRNTVMEGMETMAGHEGHHGEMTLRAAVLDRDLKKIKEWELDNRTCDCCQTAAAITGQGPVVVYRDRSSEELRDMSIVRLVNGQWTTPKSIHDDKWKIAGCPVNGPRLVASGKKVAVAWFTMAGDSARVKVAFSDNSGETFNKPIRIDEGNAIGRVDLVLLENGSVLVSWMEDTLIQAVAVSPEGKKGKSITIGSSSEARASGFPQMTLAGNRIIFAWTDAEEKNIKTAFVHLNTEN